MAGGFSPFTKKFACGNELASSDRDGSERLNQCVVAGPSVVIYPLTVGLSDWAKLLKKEIINNENAFLLLHPIPPEQIGDIRMILYWSMTLYYLDITLLAA